MWNRINYPSKIDDGKTFEKNNLTTVLSILYIKKININPAYISKINSKCEKKKKNSLNDSKRRKRRLVLSSSEKK